MADFQKLGLDRISQNIARSVNSATGNLVTGDITKGEVVEHTTSGSGVEYVNIRSRSTGAVPISVWFTNSGSADWNFELQSSNNRIAVKTSSATPCVFKFWVW